LRSFVLNTFHSMGSVLRAKIVVEIPPAITGKFVSMVAAPEFRNHFVNYA
jgi:hypothetical protein